MLYLLLTLSLLAAPFNLRATNDTASKEYAVANQVAAPLVTVHFHKRIPYYVRPEKGTFRGLILDKAITIFEKTGLPFRIMRTPAKRQLVLIKENTTADCFVGWFKTREREAIGKFTLAIHQDQPLEVVTYSANKNFPKSQISLTTLFNRTDLLLMVKMGYRYGKPIDEMIKTLKPTKVVLSTNNEKMMQFLLLKRADYMFMSSLEAQGLLKYLDIPAHTIKRIVLSDIASGNQRYIWCSRKVPDSYITSLNRVISKNVTLTKPSLN